MLVKASVIRECEAVGQGGKLGSVTDLYFDEYHWRVCYLVLETGGLLSGKRSLTPLNYLESVEWQANRLSLRMTSRGLQDGPLSDLDHNVASQLEEHSAGYVAWPPPPPQPQGSTAQVPYGEPAHPGTDEEGKPLLRSAKEVSGYAVNAADGACGHIEDLLINDSDWTVAYLLIDPKNFFPGEPRLVPVSAVERFDWLAHAVHMQQDKETIRSYPAFDEDLARQW